MTCQVRARDEGLPVAAALMLISPWVDMEVVGDSYLTNQEKDAYFYRDVVQGLTRMILGEAGNPRDPLVNALYADLAGLPPTYIHVGGHETLLDDARRLARRAEQGGVDVRLDVFPEQQHTFHMAATRAPEADDALNRFADWVRPRLGLPVAVQAA